MKQMNKALQLQALYAEARQVCEAIHGDYPFTILRFKRGKVAQAVDGLCGPLTPVGSTFATFDQHVKEFPHDQGEGFELFTVAAVTDGEGHANVNIQHTWALAVDFDHGYPDFLVNNPLVGPSFRVETSEGHYQAAWVFDAPCSTEEAKLMLKAMALRLGGDIAYAKVSQVLRLPGFLHHKHGTVPNLVEITEPLKTFTLDFLKQAFDVAVIQNHVRVAVPRLNHQLEAPKDRSNPDEEDQIGEDVESALSYLKDYAEEYTDWFSTLSALAPLGSRGKKLAETFSRQSSKFDEQGFERKWAEVLKSPGHVATVFLRAQDKGWTNPGFRNQSGYRKDQTLTERDLGRMIAAKLGDEYAVTDTRSRGVSQLTYFKFEASGYRASTDIDKRAAVEQAGKTVIAELREHQGLSADVSTRLQHKLGKNSTLDEMAVHVAESMIPETKRRIIGSYPYFVVANGVINLLTRQLVPVRYKAVPVKGPSPVVYDPASIAPVFKTTVSQVFEGDRQMIRYFMQVVGYMMLGLPKEQIFLVIYGPSAGNGKNTLMDAVEYVMGGYAMKLPPSAILEKSHNNDSATPSTARMEGKRMVVVSEPSAKHQIDSGAVKAMVGDLTMPVRDNYESAKDIANEFILILMANKLPKVSVDDHGLWRRAKVIPFMRTFRGDQIDRDLPIKLRAEASGILNLMLAGAHDYLVNGLVEPEKVTVATLKERESVDTVAAFVKDTMRTGVDDETPMKMIFVMYEAWRHQNHTYTRLSKQALGKGLEDKGYKKSIRGNLVYYHGMLPIEIPSD